MLYKLSEEDKRNFIQALYFLLHIDWAKEDEKIIHDVKNMLELNNFNPSHISNEDDAIDIIKRIQYKQIIRDLCEIAREAGKHKPNKEAYYSKLKKICERIKYEMNINIDMDITKDDLNNLNNRVSKHGQILRKILSIILVVIKIFLVLLAIFIGLTLLITGHYLLFLLLIGISVLAKIYLKRK